jgi:hypothetical protein
MSCSAAVLHRLAFLIVILALGFASLSVPAIAVQATPAASSPSGCDVPPRSLEEISALLATPAPPEPERSGVLPMGEPLRPEEQILIEQTVDQFIACSNAGEPLRVYSLYTDRYLQRLLSGERPPLDADRYEALATPMPAEPGSGAELVEITGGRRIADIGQRFGALVTIDFPATPQPKTFFFTFLPEGDRDRLLIDDVLGELTFSLP